MNFPLYSTLITNLPKRELTLVQKNEFINTITTLDTDTNELIVALIKCYYLDKDKGDVLRIPYKGEYTKETETVSFNLSDFPQELKQLLYKFIKMHNKRIIEDNEIKKMQTPA